MASSIKKLKHYNITGHVHEITCSCYRRRHYFNDSIACQIFLEELEKSRSIYNFQLWAYVIMPNHIHMLIWPLKESYDITKILGGTKSMMSKRYKKYFNNTDREIVESFHVKKRGTSLFTFWQPGGGFDRNLWNPKGIHESISYIEANPVRKKLSACPEEWKWSSAFARVNQTGLIPDKYKASVYIPDAQKQRVGKI